MLKRAAIEGFLLTAALVLGFVLWTGVAFSHENWSDRYWFAHGHPPANAEPAPYVQPALMFGPAIMLMLARAVHVVRRHARVND